MSLQDNILNRECVQGELMENALADRLLPVCDNLNQHATEGPAAPCNNTVAHYSEDTEQESSEEEESPRACQMFSGFFMLLSVFVASKMIICEFKAASAACGPYGRNHHDLSSADSELRSTLQASGEASSSSVKKSEENVGSQQEEKHVEMAEDSNESGKSNQSPVEEDVDDGKKRREEIFATRVDCVDSLGNMCVAWSAIFSMAMYKPGSGCCLNEAQITRSQNFAPHMYWFGVILMAIVFLKFIWDGKREIFACFCLDEDEAAACP